MAQTIKLKRSATSGAAPGTSDLALGEVAINTYDGKMYIKKSVSGAESVVEVGSGTTVFQYADAGMVEYEYTATANQTTFSGTDTNSATLSYTANSVLVFLNGVLQDDGTDYTATNGTSVVFTNALAANDEIRIISISSSASVHNPTKLDAITTVNGQAAYTMNVNSVGYTPSHQNALIVSVNGITQEPGDSFTISGTTITFSPALVTGDVIDYIVDMGRKMFIPSWEGNLEVTGNILPGADSTYDLGASGTEWANVYADTVTANLTGNVTGTVSSLSNHDTDDLSEGSTNLYYTDARVDSRLASGSVGNITTTGYIAGPSTFTIDPAAVGDNTGTLVVAGNLQVDGTTTTINSTTMTVDDLNITLASGAANAAAANGAGITVDGASATLTYNSTPDAWSFNKNVGIGTDSPPSKLAVADSGNVQIVVKNSDAPASSKFAQFVLNMGSTYFGANDKSWQLVQSGFSDGTTSFRIQGWNGSAYTTALTVVEDGKIGIGTTVPTNPLTVQANSGAGAVALNGRSSDGIATLGFYSSNGTTAQGYVQGRSDSLRLWAASGDYLSLGSSDTERMRIASDGKVTVYGISRFENYIEFAGSISTPATAAAIYRPADNNLAFSTANTEAMRIDSSGNVSIGTTTAIGRLTVEGVSPATNNSTLALVSAAGSSKTAGISFSGTFVSPTSDTSPRRVADITAGFSTANWTTEYMAFHVGTGASNDAMALNTERMRINGSGQLFINRTSSISTGTASKLCITGNIDIDGNPGSTNVIRMYQSATEMGQIYGHTTGLRFYNFTGGVTSIKTQADATLQLIPGAGGNDAQIQLCGNGGNIAVEGFEIWYDNDVGDVHLNTTYGSDVAAIRFHTRVGAAKSTINERLTITGGGDVGISATSPSAIISSSRILQVASGGNTTLSVTSADSVNDRSAILELLSSGNGGSKSIILYGDTDTTPGTPSPLVFQGYHSGARTERMRISSSGDVIISGTAMLASALLTVDGNGDVRNGVCARVNNNAYWNYVGISSSGSNSFYVYGDGDVENTNNSYGAISDERVKSNIVDASSQIDDIMAVQVRSYTLNETGDTHIGVVAQELEASGMSGLVKTNDDGMKSVKYSILYMKTIKALQEAVTRIETLEAEVVALKGA